MAQIDLFNKSVTDLVDNVNRWAKFDPSTNYQRTITYSPQIQNANNTVTDPNMMVSFVRTNGEYNYASMWQAHIELLEGARLCYGLYDAKVYVGNVDTGETVKNLVLLGYSRNGITQNYFIDNTNTVYGATSQQTGRMVETDNDGRNVYSVSGSTQSWRGVNFETFSINVNAWRNLADYYKNYIIDHLTPTDDTLKNSVNTIQSSINDLVIGGSSSYQWFNGAWFNMGKSGRHAQAFTYNMLPFPVFDITDTDHIIAYLNTGNRTGEIDIFDPTPKTKKINDFDTNFRVFITPTNNNNDTHFSIIAYNNDTINNWSEFNDTYVVSAYEEQVGTYNNRLIGNTPKNAKYPTFNFTHTMINTSVSYNLSFYYHNAEDVGSAGHYDGTSGLFGLNLNYDSTKEGKCKVSGAWYDMSGYTGLSRTNVVDGYRFTNSNGNWVEVLFRAVDIDDVNGGYPDDEDDENDKTGTDSTTVIGNGLNTFTITPSQFGTINNKMWSTDWINVFKSNSIDPIRCVIACKSIPFTASASSSADVIIANMNTGVHANTVNPVKSFNVGYYSMPYYRGDFSDITMTQVRVYLPFIGWVELPGAEVISRVAYANQRGNIKRLGFKYLVDFVDGACRCVVSVNGTERWYFDGNCGIDVPVTSDNHTQAVSTAIRSGVGSVLSLASAVGGAVSGNGMMVATGVIGAIGNGMNTFPTYNYSASASPSGYINASMNTHIMIVIEHPNMIEADDYAHKYGKPCGLTLPLGSLRGFTRCSNVDTSGINGTPNELSMIKSALESGVYL